MTANHDHGRGRGDDPVGDATANSAVDRPYRVCGSRDSGRGGSQSPIAGSSLPPNYSSGDSRGNKDRKPGSDAQNSRLSGSGNENHSQSKCCEPSGAKAHAGPPQKDLMYWLLRA